MTGEARECSGVSRRGFLRIGGLASLGLTLPDALRARADAPGAPEVNCILITLLGAPSHHETFDPKPEAPAEIRGEFGAIPAKIGVRFGELIPRIAAVSDRLSLLRAVHHADGDHDSAQTLMYSGYPFSPSLSYPSYGSVVAREKGFRGGMPPYVLAGSPKAAGAGYMGDLYNPLVIRDNPADPKFSVKEITPPPAVTDGRLARRQRMIAALDRFRGRTEARGEISGTLDSFMARSLDLISSPAAKKAFSLRDEPPKVRERFGMHAFGQQCLLARRLIEAGVRFVTVGDAGKGGWDTHADNFNRLKRDLLPPFDQGYSALLEDLNERGLLASTLVIAMGEFGRTPHINPAAGRDHWPRVFPVALGGGPIKLGRLIGGSDGIGGEPVERPVSMADFAATVYRALQVEYRKEYVTPEGRPTPIVYHGEPVAELF
ncbi:MAG: DUF1501 domain-containing protein [Armatimonadetes bacterium]|nr:DUF1501 domain-containing protein [Armatimonadota bacterium]